MKITTPSKTSLQSTATLLGGVVVGGMVSKGAIGLIHDDATASAKSKNLKRVGLLVAGIALASAVNGKDTVADLVRGAATGIAGTQALELVRDLSADNSQINAMAASSSKAKRFVAESLGLACPCSSQLNGAKRKRRGLREPFVAYTAPQFPVAQIQQPDVLQTIIAAA